jgi:hypothetical protein
LSAELIAILQALGLIEADSLLQWVICSDFLVVLQLLLSPTNTCSDLVYGIHKLLIWLNDSKIMHLLWVKAHIGIIGNEHADAVTKLGHHLDHSALLTSSCSDALAGLMSHFLCFWELDWVTTAATDGRGHHLASIRFGMSPVPSSQWVACRSRCATVVLTCLHLGHVGFHSHLHLFGMADTPMCLHCGVKESIEYFLLSCKLYDCERQVMISSIHALGVPLISVPVLLGGGNYPSRVQHHIVGATTTYLMQIGQLSAM